MHPSEEVRNLKLTAEDVDLLAHILRFTFNNHASPNIRAIAADFLMRLESLQNKK